MLNFIDSKDPKSILEDKRFLAQREEELILGEIVISEDGSFFRCRTGAVLSCQDMQDILSFIEKEAKPVQSKDVLIWWLNQPETEEVFSDCLRILPLYLQDEVGDRYGRAGRGRLWIHESLPKVGIDPWPDTELANYLGKDSGGIVFWKSDLENVKDLPGIITDLQLNRV